VNDLKDDAIKRNDLKDDVIDEELKDFELEDF